MKLWDVPRNTRIKVTDNTEIKVPPAAPPIQQNDEINFHHIDGMYSYCTTDDGQIVHLASWTEVEIIPQ